MTEETGAVESPQPEEQQTVADVSSDDLRELLGTEQVEVGQPDQPETEQAEPVPEEAALEGAYPEETEEERLAKRRIRPKSALDQQVLDLYKSDAFDGSFADASRVIYGQEVQQPQALQEQRRAEPAPDPLDRYDERVHALRREIAGLETQVDEAADNLDTADALKLQREVTRRELEVQGLLSSKTQIQQRRREQAYDTHRGKAMESRDRAMEAVPELQDKESLVRKQFDEYVRVAQDNPDYASVFESPLWPEIMTREFAVAMYSQQAQNEAAAPQAPPQQAPVMGNQAQVLTSGTTAQPLNSPLTRDQATGVIPDMSNEQLYNLLGQPDGQRFLR